MIRASVASWLKVGIFAVILLAVFTVIANKVLAYSANGPCYYTNQNCSISNVVCGTNDVFSSGRTPADCFPGAGNYAMPNPMSVSSFISFIINKFDSNSVGSKDRRAARMVMEKMLGLASGGSLQAPWTDQLMKDQFALRLSQSDIAIARTNMPLDRTSYYDNIRDDFFFTTYDSPQNAISRSVYIIYSKSIGLQNGWYGIFEEYCGNPVMFAKDGVPYTATLTLDNQVSPKTADVTNTSATINFAGSITASYALEGAPYKTTANYNWKYEVVRKADNTVLSSQTGNAKFIDPNPQASPKYTLNLAVGDMAGDYCSVLTVTNWAPNDPTFSVTVKPSGPACVRVTVTCVGGRCTPVVMNMDSAAQGGSTVTTEPEQNVAGGVLRDVVTNAPQLSNKEWGYTQAATPTTASKVNKAEIRPYYIPASPITLPPVPPGQTLSPVVPPTIISTIVKPPGVSCAWFGTGYVDLGGNCVKYGSATCLPGFSPFDATNCVSYSCAIGTLSGGMCINITSPQYNWYCPDPNNAGVIVSYGLYTTTVPPCNSYYSAAPCSNDGSTYSLGGPGLTVACNDAWTCPYSGTVFTNKGQPLCEYRCAADGQRAPLATSKMGLVGTNSFETWSGGDLNCYRPWQVTVTCTYAYIGNWASKDPANSMGTITVTVNAGTSPDLSNICAKSFSYYGGYVGDVDCAQITTLIGAFETNNSTYLTPDQRLVPNGLTWSTRTVTPTAQQCYQTIARPFLSFSKTDVRAYAGSVSVWGGWTGTKAYGSTADYAVYATYMVDGLSSNYARATNATPKTRTFANVNTNTYGGDFGSTSATKFDQYITTMGAGKPCTGIPSTFTTSVVINCSTTTVTISSDIDTGWTYANPKSLYIIADTINISGNVSNLAGVGLIARTISTCSDGANGCGNPLNIKGFVSSQTIHYDRAANHGGGSSFYCARPSRPGDLPGWVNQTCSVYNRSAEVITYSPEFEISPAPYTPTGGVQSGKYDSIRSLPPIY